MLSQSLCHAQSFWKPNQFEQLDLKRTVVVKARTEGSKINLSLLVPAWQSTSDGGVNTSKPLESTRVDLPIEHVKAWYVTGQQIDDQTLAAIFREARHALALPQGITGYVADPYYSTILQPSTIVLATSSKPFPASEKPTPKPSSVAASPTAGAAQSRPVNVASEETMVIDRTNQERAGQGLAALRRNEKLMLAARKHSQTMARQRTLSHNLGGTSFMTRAEAEGYRFSNGGENIALGALTSTEVVGMWMRSPGHRANILDANYTEIGVGFAFDAEGRRFDTQVFGRPALPPTPSTQIATPTPTLKNSSPATPAANNPARTSKSNESR